VMLSSNSKTDLRKQGRSARRSLTRPQRRLAARRLNQRLTPLLHRGHRIGLYLHFDGEPDLLPCLKQLCRRGKQVYVPQLRPQGMRFVPLRALRRARVNHYGIIEPNRHSPSVSSKRLQAVVLPLTAYDLNGQRLGMGAGYYDRELSWRSSRTHWRGPLLIGSAWSCQAAQQIPTESWDIPLNRLCNEQQTLRF
jgi:5-formyltetrahydrofolate cyclo-ligase